MIVFFGIRWPFALNILKSIAKEHNIVRGEESTGGDIAYSKASAILKTTLKRIILKSAQMFRRNSLKSLAVSINAKHYIFDGQDSEPLIAWLKSLFPDIGCTASFHRLLKPEVLNLFPKGIINCHPSLLPKYRGPNPLFWHYYNMDKKGGVTIHDVEKGEDTGDILRQEEFLIYPGMPFDEMVDIITKIGGTINGPNFK